VILRFENIYIDGSGMITDPDSKNLEVITFRAPIANAEVTLNPEEIYKQDGTIYPKFNVKDVKIGIDHPNTIVSAFGHVPLFKTKKFEDTIKKWLERETQNTLVP
jgi:hypothetical protein